MDLDVVSSVVHTTIPAKETAMRKLTSDKINWGSADIENRPKVLIQDTVAKQSLRDRINLATALGDVKLKYKLLKSKMEGIESADIVQGLEGQDPKDFDKLICQKFLRMLSGPYVSIEYTPFKIDLSYK